MLENRGERTVSDIAASLGVAENLLHAWERKLGSAAEQVRRERGGETQEDELKRLRREVTQLKQERDVAVGVSRSAYYACRRSPPSERELRYVTRPPVAQERLERLPDGSLELRLKHPWKDGQLALAFGS